MQRQSIFVRAGFTFISISLILSRGPDSEGEWREHHWEDILASHSLDPEQVRYIPFQIINKRAWLTQTQMPEMTSNPFTANTPLHVCGLTTQKMRRGDCETF